MKSIHYIKIISIVSLLLSIAALTLSLSSIASLILMNRNNKELDIIENSINK